MKLLLDTHIWLWSLLEPEKLSRRVIRELENSENELWLSPISIWEVLMLSEKGRIEIAGDVDIWVTERLNASPLHEAPVTHEVAMEIHRFRLPHRDPADRFLVATARVFHLTLVTSDSRLLKIRDTPILPNR